MFRDRIIETPFVLPAGDEMFSNINAATDIPADCSMLSTIRALAAPRLQDHEQISLCYENFFVGRTEPDFANGCPLLKDGECNDALIIYNVGCAPDEIESIFKNIDGNFQKSFKGFKKAPLIKKYFSGAFSVSCFIDMKKKLTVVFVARIDNEKWHYLQSAITALLPWLFEENKLTEEEKALIKSFLSGSSKAYKSSIYKLSERYDFRTAEIKAALGDFEIRVEKNKIPEIEQTINNYKRDLQSLMDSVGSTIAQIRESESRLIGLKEMVKRGGGKHELMDFFLANKRLGIVYNSPNELQFTVKGYLCDFDREEAKAQINNDYADIYSYPGNLGRENLKMLLESIFVEEKLRIRFCASYKIYISQNLVNSCGGYEFPEEFANYMPNPHIREYNCMGSFGMAFADAFERNDYVSVVDICCGSCFNLNWSDPSVMTHFIKYLTGEEVCNINCIELPDGRIVTPKKAVKYLKGEDID